jgi:transposase
MTKRLWAGLDVGVETTSVRIIDDKGELVHGASCPTELGSVHRELARLRRLRSAKVALEAGTGMTLARGLRSLGYSVEIYDARQLSKFLRMRRNKTDAGDASGIAEACRIGLSGLSTVHLKSLEGQRLQSRLAIRRHLIRQRVASINMVGRQLELFGGRLDRSQARHLRSHVEMQIVRLFGKVPNDLTRELRHLVDHCEQLLAHEQEVDRELRQVAMDNEVCRRFMEIPGVGPFCALTFYAAVDDPRRFHRTADIGP